MQYLAYWLFNKVAWPSPWPFKGIQNVSTIRFWKLMCSFHGNTSRMMHHFWITASESCATFILTFLCYQGCVVIWRLACQPTQLFRSMGHWGSAVLVLNGAMDRGIPRHRAVYFAQFSNGGQNLVKMWLRRDLNPCAKNKCFGGKGAMRYNTVSTVWEAAVLVVCIRPCWVIPPPISIYCSIIGPKYIRYTVAHCNSERQNCKKKKKKKKKKKQAKKV